MLKQARSTQRRPRTVPGDEPRLIRQIIELASAYGRYGYRRISALLRREGWGRVDEICSSLCRFFFMIRSLQKAEIYQISRLAVGTVFGEMVQLTRPHSRGDGPSREAVVLHSALSGAPDRHNFSGFFSPGPEFRCLKG